MLSPALPVRVAEARALRPPHTAGTGSAATAGSVAATGLRVSRRSGDDGSSQILMPVGVLVVLLLGAIAFDLSWVYQAQRELIDTASSAANYAVTYGLAPESLRDGSGGRLDSRRVIEAVERSLSVHHLSGVDPNRTDVTITGGDRVTVSLVRHVDYVFAKSIPGARRGREVTATISATVIQR